MTNYTKYAKPYTATAYINSLNKGQMQSDKTDEITILGEAMDRNQKLYVADYKGILCTAIFNWFTCSYYADDVYGVINE